MSRLSRHNDDFLSLLKHMLPRGGMVGERGGGRGGGGGGVVM